MLKRYTTDTSGKKHLLAKIYNKDEHSIDLEAIDPLAVRICRRLKREGYEAFIVGGAVRDLLQKKTPKDFDIATNAFPKKIRKFFWNSRIIGKRFKLVHIHFKDQIFEVSTFRSNEDEDSQNVFGSIEQDVKRRDFSVNALFYCPSTQQILDFVDGMKDIKEKRIRSLIPLDKTFTEDPVRIIRGIKYSCTTNFKIERKLKKAMQRYADLLKTTPSSRLTEELFKILESKYSYSIMTGLQKIKAFGCILPNIEAITAKDTSLKKEFFSSLKRLDEKLRSGELLDRGIILSFLLKPFLRPNNDPDVDLLFLDIFTNAKKILSPLTPPNVEIENAVKRIMSDMGINVPQNKRLSYQKSKRKALQKTAGPAPRKYRKPRHRK